MNLDPVLLSRVQFAVTIMFHYLFPPLTIGLGLLMVIMEYRFLKTGDSFYRNMTKFWTSLFAVNFALGVATGIVMEFQFGTNWADYSRYVGDVFGSALAAEGIFAFFLESGFLAVVIFGWDKVSARVHFVSTLLVAAGSIFSAVWIVVANSWQQTPAGFHLVQHANGVRAEITDFWALVFNPSSMDRLMHVLLGSFILGSFFVMSISAYYLLKGRFLRFARESFTIALTTGFIFSVLMLFSGHRQARIVSHTQPAKLAAFEGHFKTAQEGTALYLFGYPDSISETVRFGLKIPGLLSLLVYGDPNRPVPALDQVRPDERPPVAVPFYSYHLMVALGTFFIGLTTLGAILRFRGVLFEQRWLLWIFVFAVAGPYIANQIGWAAAEVGRQPWVVYGLLKTSDAVSPSVDGAQIAVSLALFLVIYALLFLVWVYVTDSKIKRGPQEAEGEEHKEGFLQAAVDSAGKSMTEAKD